MEKEINQVLEMSGLSEKKQKELEELELNKLSKEEVYCDILMPQDDPKTCRIGQNEIAFVLSRTKTKENCQNQKQNLP